MIEDIERKIDFLNGLNAQKRYQEARADCQDLLAIDKGDARLWLVAGNALYGLGQLEEAAQAYETAIALMPSLVQARSNYAMALFVTGRQIDALNAAEAAIYADETFAPPYLTAAACLTALGHNGEAVAALKAGWELASADAQNAERMAEELWHLGDYAAARDIFLALAKRPKAPADVHERLAALFQEAKNKGISRVALVADIAAWRRDFGNNPAVFDLARRLEI